MPLFPRSYLWRFASMQVSHVWCSILNPQTRRWVWKLSVQSNHLLSLKGCRSRWAPAFRGHLTRSGMSGVEWLNLFNVILHFLLILHYLCWTSSDYICEIAISATNSAALSCQLTKPDLCFNLQTCTTLYLYLYLYLDLYLYLYLYLYLCKYNCAALLCSWRSCARAWPPVHWLYLNPVPLDGR